MNDQLAERLCNALEQLALELATANERGTVPPQLTAAPALLPIPEPDPFPAFQWLCPVHGVSKVVPAGISKRTGQAYQAFIACSSPGCNEKPPRAGAPAPARAAAPLPQGLAPQGRVLP